MENEYNRHKKYLTFLRNTFNVLPLSLKIITVLALFGLVSIVSIPIIKFFSPKTSDALVTECLGVKVKDTCYGKLNEVIIVSGT